MRWLRYWKWRYDRKVEIAYRNRLIQWMADHE